MENEEANALLLKTVDELLHLISHRIRRPIVSALGLFRLLVADDTTAEEKQRVLDYLAQTIKEMDQCTEELIDALEKVKRSIDRK